jgi:hypothetical protein
LISAVKHQAKEPMINIHIDSLQCSIHLQTRGTQAKVPLTRNCVSYRLAGDQTSIQAVSSVSVRAKSEYCVQKSSGARTVHFVVFARPDKNAVTPKLCDYTLRLHPLYKPHVCISFEMTRSAAMLPASAERPEPRWRHDNADVGSRLLAELIVQKEWPSSGIVVYGFSMESSSVKCWAR